MPGERSPIFCFVRKTHASCSDFYEKFTSSSRFSKKSEFLVLCHWHPNKQTSSKPKILKTTTQRSHAAKRIKKKPESRASPLNVFFNQAPKDEFSRGGQTLLVYLVTYFKFQFRVKFSQCFSVNRRYFSTRHQIPEASLKSVWLILPN